MKDESKELFLTYGKEYQKAIKEEDFLKSFSIILDGIKAADKVNDREVIEIMSGLIKTLQILISAKYGVSNRNCLKINAYNCFFCGNSYKKEELLLGSKGEICRNCAILAHETFLLNP